MPLLDTHILMGGTGPQKTRNAVRNIEKSRTHPVKLICRKPAGAPCEMGFYSIEGFASHDSYGKHEAVGW